MSAFTDQRALTLIAPIDSHHQQALEQLLLTTDYKSLMSMPGVHFGRLLILHKTQQLVYAVNHDGAYEAHLAVMAKNPLLPTVFACCQGYPSALPPEQAIPQFVEQYRQQVQAFYRGHRGLSVDQILLEQEMYEEIQSHLDKAGYAGLPPLETCQAIKKHIRSQLPALQPFQAYRLPYIKPNLLRVLLIGLVLLVIAGAFLIHTWLGVALIAILLLAVGLLRWKEKHDPILADNDIPMGNTSQLMSQEDFISQNQMTHYVSLKPGLLRTVLLRTGLFLVNILARYSFNQGSLSDISSIHFARWQIINKGKELLFFSNFDGTWENYLSDFVDRACIGLTLIWSNTIEFPRTVFWAGAGAADEERFKNWTRKYQVKTDIWFSAYKNLTVKNIIRNHQIRMGLQQDFNASQAAAWLKML
jgi:hypothetical protein